MNFDYTEEQQLIMETAQRFVEEELYPHEEEVERTGEVSDCLLYTSPSPRDLSTSRMPSSA